MLALALLAGVGAVSLRDATGQERATRAATDAARTTLEQMLSYGYTTIDGQAARVEGLLTGSFRKEFTQAMDSQIKPLAVKNQSVVQARVSDIGVVRASADRVTLLAFVDQATLKAGAKQPAIDQNRVLLTVSRVGDRWLVSDVKAF